MVSKYSKITSSFIAITKLTYFSDGRGLTYDEMKLRCVSKNSRFCYFDELCPDGGPNKPPVGGQQTTKDMWVPIVNSLSDPSPNWIQVGSNKPGLCGGVSYWGTPNVDGSWMVTNTDEPHKAMYACCPKGEFVIN